MSADSPVNPRFSHRRTASNETAAEEARRSIVQGANNVSRMTRRVSRIHETYPDSINKARQWNRYIDEVARSCRHVSLELKRYGSGKHQSANLFVISPGESNVLTSWEEEAVVVRVLNATFPHTFSPEEPPRLVLGKHAVARLIERSDFGDWQSMNPDELFTKARETVLAEVRSVLPWCYFFFFLLGEGSVSRHHALRVMAPTANGVLLVSYVREMLVIHARTFLHDTQLSTRQAQAKAGLQAMLPPDWLSALNLGSLELSNTRADRAASGILRRLINQGLVKPPITHES